MTTVRPGVETKTCAVCSAVIVRPLKGRGSSNMDWLRRKFCGSACTYEANKMAAWKRRACGDGQAQGW